MPSREQSLSIDRFYPSGSFDVTRWQTLDELDATQRCRGGWIQHAGVLQGTFETDRIRLRLPMFVFEHVEQQFLLLFKIKRG